MRESGDNYADGRYSLLQALPTGYCFSEFEIEEVVGRGGFGIVYRAWDHRKKRAIAIKEYLPATIVTRRNDLILNLRRASFQKRFKTGLHCFMREAHIMGCFNHPCLPRFLRFWQQNSTAYIATPFYHGVTLKTLHVRYPKIITQNWLCNILFPLLDAINTLHLAGYLHCDISPDNILIQNDQLPILLDLGSVRKTTKSLTDDEEITVRPGFTPYEQYAANSEENRQGPWTDIYALGAVLHTMVVGKPPPVSIMRDIEDHYHPLTQLCPAGYSASFLHAIDCMLATDVSERPPTIAKLVSMIKPCIFQASHIPAFTTLSSDILANCLYSDSSISDRQGGT
ncbi:MAG: serine/threonine protein kinase [Enterobacteriaceae bacterium]|jgi:serine/threonine protein kinase|nr:serine/threonine protein kinase [Enterobacteriaceae bacterium]